MCFVGEKVLANKFYNFLSFENPKKKMFTSIGPISFTEEKKFPTFILPSEASEAKVEIPEASVSLWPAATWEEFAQRYLSPEDASRGLIQRLQADLTSPKDFLFSQLSQEPRFKNYSQRDIPKLENAIKSETLAAVNAVNDSKIGTDISSMTGVSGWAPVSTVEELVARYPEIDEQLKRIKSAFKVTAMSTTSALKNVLDSSVWKSKVQRLTMSERLSLTQPMENEKIIKFWVQITGRPWTPESWSKKLVWIEQLPQFAALDSLNPEMRSRELGKLKSYDDAVRAMWYYYVTSKMPAAAVVTPVQLSDDRLSSLPTSPAGYDNYGNNCHNYVDICDHCGRPIVYLFE